MKLTIKATLLSALVYPGLGHFILKKYFTCTVFLFITTYSIVNLTSNIYSKLNTIKAEIQNGNLERTFPAIRQALYEQNTLDNPALTNNATILFIVWLIAAVDACRIAYAKELNNR
jgi:hypothetical protein